MPSENGKTGPKWSWDTALCGVVPPIISPLNETGESDGDALNALVGHILAQLPMSVGLCEASAGENPSVFAG